MIKKIARWIEKRIVEDTRKKIGIEISRINGKILDLGCGERGSFDYRDRSIVSSDRSAEKLRNLNSKIKIVADAEKKLPFRSGEFDAVIFSGVIQYLRYYENSVGEIKRVLKPRGTLVLATVNKNSLFRRIGVISRRLKIEAGEKKIFSLKEVTSLLESKDLEVKMTIGSDFMKMPKKLSSNLILVAVKIR